MLHAGSGPELARGPARVPPSVLAAASATLYRTSAAGKFHAGDYCHTVTNRSPRHRMAPVRVTAAEVTTARCCLCLTYRLPQEFAPVLQPVAVFDRLAGATDQVAAAGPDCPASLDLAALGALTGLLEEAGPAQRALLAALAPAPEPVRATAAAWAAALCERAEAVAVAARASLAGDPERALRAAAAACLGPLADRHDKLRHPALTRNGYQPAAEVFTAAQDAFDAAVADRADPAAITARTLAVLAQARPTELAQIPDVPVSGPSLRQAMTAAWRTAARAELGALVEQALAEYTELLGQRHLVLLVAHELSAASTGLVRGYPSRPAGPGPGVWLVPAVIGRGVAARNRVVLAEGPLPAGVDLSGADATSQRAFLDGDYVAALLRLLAEGLDPQDAVTAALGVVS